MGAEIDLAEEEAATIFSAPRIRSRLAQGGYAVDAFRETLRWGRDRLYGLFTDGMPADSLVHARAHLVDEVLRAAWHKFLPGVSEGLALVAVGGYGRGELLPHSDIDILLLHSGDTLEQQRKALEGLTAFCWDIGLEVGQSARTVEECVAEAAKDITVMTNLLEARLLTGDIALFQRMQQALTPDKIWPVKAFFEAKKAEQTARHRKYDDTGYKLEPNVKESPGGLRDIHTIAWVMKRHFGAQTLAELRERGFLTKQECDELFAGQDFLWRVRFALHMINGRREDRLLFDSQVKVAQLFGYVDTDANKAVEQFMQLYYRTIKTLSCLNDMLLQLFEEAILRPDSGEPEPLNPRFQIRNGYIEARDDEVFRRQPWALLEIFLLLQQHPRIEGIRAQTLRMILRDGKYMTDEVRASVKARALFMEMFREGRGLTRNLRRMNRYGVLGRYLPAFGRIVGLMQYDLFHTLTVDEHILYVVRNARRFAMQRFRHELPFCSEVMQRLPKPELLYLAAFWHDMAKGRKGDHSQIGAEEAEQFCLQHGLSHTDAALVGWLVQNHLLMSLTAQKQDISDARVVAEFARKVGTRTRLDYLFLLTCADIRGTNPALWNSWREALLKDLYRQSVRVLEDGIDQQTLEQERAAETRQRALELLEARGVARDTAERVWQRFERDYFLRHTPEELAWQLPAIATATDDTLPLVMVESVDERGTTVFVYTRDRDHLFGLTTGVLARLGLNILDARLHTTDDGFVLDSYTVMESDNAPIVSPMRYAEIRDALRKVLSDPEVSTIDVNRRMPQRLKHFDTPTQVYFSQDQARGRTVLELVTADQPGLLSLIGRVFQKRGILLDAAKIATIGERAEDVFYITDRMHRPITDERVLDELREVLVRTLDRRETA
ncbi:UTP--GlnB (protein PII) uridylyltransferase, GlnD [Fontimonas thermophila]|uniref:Bifunctional uridylyltransferase/uridylyl-removing enzyme n=1 Tax=Fontimonas thermophila TaxID=1076937 RepID=A0A1I2HKG2_9GAMM|nr:[protein-PII] uridylyltransferase [Fontimonas thermophila]SFF29780.1 UTP--GlnB (protein PII) uridylyltransferase, GlnD [Fontimonas thermophila]